MVFKGKYSTCHQINSYQSVHIILSIFNNNDNNAWYGNKIRKVCNNNCSNECSIM